MHLEGWEPLMQVQCTSLKNAMAVIWPYVLKTFSEEDCFQCFSPSMLRVNLANLLQCPVVEQSISTNTVHKGALRLRPLCAHRKFLCNILVKWLFQTLPHVGTSTLMASLTPGAGSAHNSLGKGSSAKGDSRPGSWCSAVSSSYAEGEAGSWPLENPKQECGSYSVNRLGYRWRLWAGCPQLSSLARPRIFLRKGIKTSYVAAQDPGV